MTIRPLGWNVTIFSPNIMFDHQQTNLMQKQHLIHICLDLHPIRNSTSSSQLPCVPQGISKSIHSGLSGMVNVVLKQTRMDCTGSICASLHPTVLQLLSLHIYLEDKRVLPPDRTLSVHVYVVTPGG